MKRGKEIKIEKISNLNVIFGTVDSKNPKSLYINISGWGEPLGKEEMDYNRIISNIRKQIKQEIHNNGDKNYFYLDKSIVDFDMRESGIIYGKKSYMSCEITLFINISQFNAPMFLSTDLQNKLIEILILVTSNVLETNEYFKFYKTKE